MGTSVASPHPSARRPPGAGRSYGAILWDAAITPLNLILFAVGTALVALGLALDAAVTAIPVILNVAVQAGLEATAKRRLDQLRILFAPRATVVRDGREVTADLATLVVGDVVVLTRGDQVVLDGTVVDGEIEVDESLLTGESDPAVRRPGDLRPGAPVGRGRLAETRSEVAAARAPVEAHELGAGSTGLGNGEAGSLPCVERGSGGTDVEHRAAGL